VNVPKIGCIRSQIGANGADYGLSQIEAFVAAIAVGKERPVMRFHGGDASKSSTLGIGENVMPSYVAAEGEA
jgi:hypothetical protein